MQDKLHDFFSGFAGIVFIVPVVILLLGLYIRYGSIENTYKPRYNKPTPIHIAQNPSSKSTPSFNFLSPFTCRLDDEEASMSAYRNGKNIQFQIYRKGETAYYLIQNDCLYIWKSTLSKGQKQCGVNQQIEIVDMLLSSGMAQADFLIDFLPQNVKPVPIKKFIQTCKNILPKDPLLFTLPKEVMFEEIKKMPRL